MREAVVSVVIPTRNRPRQVMAAVASALAQLEALEVIVVIDGPDPETARALDELDEPRLRVVQHAVSQGAGAARNAGVAAARGTLVAFLDDDDRWLRGKLAAQLNHLATAGDGPVVVGCQGWFDDGSTRRAWPTRAPRAGEPVAHYLFIRRHAGEGALPTPTLLMETALARKVPMPAHLRTHEEWDWMLDLEAAGARFEVVLQPLVEIDARPRRSSVSNSAGWRRSLAWALGRADDLGREAFSAFVLTEVARVAALDGASLRDQLAIGAIAASGRPRGLDLLRWSARPLVFRVKSLAGGRR